MSESKENSNIADFSESDWNLCEIVKDNSPCLKNNKVRQTFFRNCGHIVWPNTTAADLQI